MRHPLLTVLLALIGLALSACASAPQHQGLLVGSVASKNLFFDASQFANRRVKLRLRNSSGDQQLDMSRLRTTIERGLRGAGYEIVDTGFGILVDVNLYQVQSAAAARVRDNSALSTLLGGVVGYEIARQGRGGVSSGGGAILGAIAGYKLEEVIRAHSAMTSYIALSDVNIGVVRRDSRSADSFVIGGNKFEFKDESELSTFTNFALRDSVRIAVYAGDDYEKRSQTVDALLERLGRIVANII